MLCLTLAADSAATCLATVAAAALTAAILAYYEIAGVPDGFLGATVAAAANAIRSAILYIYKEIL